LATNEEKLNVRKLEGKIALVTGGTAGIGLATAQRFVKEGADIFVTGRDSRAGCSREASERPRHGVKSPTLENSMTWTSFSPEIKREKGRLDIVYANAAAAAFAPIAPITKSTSIRTFDTNVKGTLFTVQKALPLVPDGG